MENDTMIRLRLPETLKAELERLAGAEGRSLSSMARRLLVLALKAREAEK